MDFTYRIQLEIFIPNLAHYLLFSEYIYKCLISKHLSRDKSRQPAKKSVPIKYIFLFFTDKKWVGKSVYIFYK